MVAVANELVELLDRQSVLAEIAQVQLDFPFFEEGLGFAASGAGRLLQKLNFRVAQDSISFGEDQVKCRNPLECFPEGATTGSSCDKNSEAKLEDISPGMQWRSRPRGTFTSFCAAALAAYAFNSLSTLASLRKYRSFGPRPVAFFALVDGRTNTWAPYSRSFCNPGLQGRCAKFSNVPTPLKAMTCGANCSSFWASIMRPSAYSSRVNSSIPRVGRLTRSVNPIPNSIMRLSSRWSSSSGTTPES